MRSPHLPSCDAEPGETWDDGTERYCEVCGALLAIWPEDSDRGWEEIA